MALAVVLSSVGQINADSAALLEEQFEASGADQLEEMLPDYAQEYLDKIGLNLEPDSTNIISGEDAVEIITDIAVQKAKQPLAVCACALVLIVLSSLTKHMSGTSNSLTTSFDTISSTAAVLTVCIPVAVFIDGIADTIGYVCRFGSVLIPVLSGLAAASGKTASAAACSAVTLAALETIMIILPTVIVPVLRVLLGISMVSSLCGYFDLGRLASTVEKILRWMLGLAGVFLSGVLAVSTIAASASDGAATKATRFVLSGAVPVVGGVISEAIGTIANCVDIIRSSVGAFGIVAGLFIVFPSIILAALWLGGLNLSAWAADGLGTGQTGTVMKAMSSVVSLSLGLIAFSAMTVTCSAALIMTLRST